MNICFFGSSLVSSYWNGAATYYRGLLKALALRGHRICFFEPDALDRQQHRDIPDPDWATVFVYPSDADGWRRVLECAVKSADVLVKASGVGVFDRELEIAIPQACRSSSLAIFWDVDAPATLQRIWNDSHDHMRAAIPGYDMVLTYGGGDPVVNAYKRIGARFCAPVYNAVDPDLHRPARSSPEYRCDVNFLGNRLPDREHRVEEFFIEPARRHPDKRFVIGGSGWNQCDMPDNVRAIGHVGTRSHNTFLRSALATVNITRDSMARNGFSPATRVFEAAGTGACLITDEWDGIEVFLEPDKEVLVAACCTSMAELVGELDEARARKIGQAALRRVRSEHTYAHRARQVETILENTVTPRRLTA